MKFCSVLAETANKCVSGVLFPLTVKYSLKKSCSLISLKLHLSIKVRVAGILLFIYLIFNEPMFKRC